MKLPFAVLNPGGRDSTQTFPQGPGTPGDSGHPPVNYHAYAACCQGGFYRKTAEIPAEVTTVLVLLRRKGLADARQAVGDLQTSGRRVWISWKESGLHQVAEALSDAKRLELFRAICREADGALSSTPELEPLYRTSGCRRSAFVATPYPVDSEAWNFSQEIAERNGIFIGTREFAVPSRNHLLATASAATLGPVTVINTDGRQGERLLKSLGPAIRIVNGPLPYPEYLRLIASHRIVYQQDRSAVPGQVAGDALLARVPCLGGDGAVDRIAFPEFSGPRTDTLALAEKLLTDDTAYRRAIDQAEQTALESLSFKATALKLQELMR